MRWKRIIRVALFLFRQVTASTVGQSGLVENHRNDVVNQYTPIDDHPSSSSTAGAPRATSAFLDPFLLSLSDVSSEPVPEEWIIPGTHLYAIIRKAQQRHTQLAQQRSVLRYPQSTAKEELLIPEQLAAEDVLQSKNGTLPITTPPESMEQPDNLEEADLVLSILDLQYDHLDHLLRTLNHTLNLLFLNVLQPGLSLDLLSTNQTLAQEDRMKLYADEVIRSLKQSASIVELLQILTYGGQNWYQVDRDEIRRQLSRWDLVSDPLAQIGLENSSPKKSNDLMDGMLKKLEGDVEQLEEGISQKQRVSLDEGKEKGRLETVIKVDDLAPEPKPPASSDNLLDESLRGPSDQAVNTSLPVTHPDKESLRDSSKVQSASVLIDTENNQYVLSRSNDPTAHIEDAKLFLDLVQLIALCALLGFLVHLLDFSPFFGYILAGVLLGPSTWNRIKSVIQIETISQFGILLILFVLGLEFSLDKVKKQWRIAVIGGFLTMLLVMIPTGMVGLYLRFPAHQWILFGVALSLSSTTVVLQCLQRIPGASRSMFGRSILGVLVVQDIGLGFMLAFLPLLSRMKAEHASLAMSSVSPNAKSFGFVSIGSQIGVVVAKMICFCAVVAALQRSILPPLQTFVRRRASMELQLMLTLCICVLIVLLGSQFEVTAEVGCFVAGIALKNDRFPMDRKLLRRIETLRDLFGALFFSSMGLHIFPTLMLNQAPLLFGLALSVMLLKTLCGMVVMQGILRLDSRFAVVLSAGLCQVSEFGFVLASRAKSLGIVQKQAYYVLVGVTAISLFATPFLWSAMAMSGWIPVGGTSLSRKRATSDPYTEPVSAASSDDSHDDMPSGHERVLRRRQGVPPLSEVTRKPSKSKERTADWTRPGDNIVIPVHSDFPADLQQDYGPGWSHNRSRVEETTS